MCLLELHASIRAAEWSYVCIFTFYDNSAVLEYGFRHFWQKLCIFFEHGAFLHYTHVSFFSAIGSVCVWGTVHGAEAGTQGLAEKAGKAHVLPPVSGEHFNKSHFEGTSVYQQSSKEFNFSLWPKESFDCQANSSGAVFQVLTEAENKVWDVTAS